MEITFKNNNIYYYHHHSHRERELFMQTHGHFLPPIFFKVISTIKEKPPYFNLTVTEVRLYIYNSNKLIKTASNLARDQCIRCVSDGVGYW